jgi:hypothetical protein
MMKIAKSIALFCFLYMPLAYSQCAPGVPSAGNPGCIPQDRPESPNFRGNPDQLYNQAPQPEAVWADRWGAVAIDMDTGQAGAAVDQASKSAALSAALKNCALNGSPHCEIAIAYHNQCAAIVWASSAQITAHAATQSDARSMAMQECTKSHVDCRMVYSACSLPERIQ